MFFLTFGKLKSPIPTCPTTLPTAWASSLRLWALRKIFKSMGAVKDSPKISTLKASYLTDSLISFWSKCERFEGFKPKHITQNDVDFTKVSWEHSFQLPTHITDVDPLTFSLCGSSHHLGPNLSKQFTPYHIQTRSSWCILSPWNFWLLGNFWLCFAKLQQKKKQKKPTFHLFHISFLWFISSHGPPIQLDIFAKAQWLHQWGDSVELLPGKEVDHKDGKWSFFFARLKKDRDSHDNLR